MHTAVAVREADSAQNTISRKDLTLMQHIGTAHQ